MLRRDRGFDSGKWWLSLRQEEEDLANCARALTKIKQVQESRHVRARTVEAHEDDVDAATWAVAKCSRDIVERSCMAKCCESKDTAHRGKCGAACAKNHILRRTHYDLSAWLLVGNRLKLQRDTWQCVLEYALPVESFGFDFHKCLRVKLAGDDRPESKYESKPWAR